MLRNSGPIFLVENQELKQYRLNKRLNILLTGLDMDMEEVKLFAGTTLYFLGVIYFTECWLTQFSILVGSIIGLRFLINLPKLFPP